MTPLVRAAHREEAITLVEMLVTTVVLSIAVAAITTSAVIIQRQVRAADAVVSDGQQARLATNQLSRLLRTAVRPGASGDPFQVAKPTHVEFFANIDTTVLGAPGPSKVRFEIVAGELIETVWEPLAGATAPYDFADPADYDATTPTRSRVLARFLQNSTAEPLFTFIDLDACTDDALGERTVCTPLDAAADATSGLSAVDLGAVDAVDIRVVVDEPSSPDIAPTVDFTRVNLRNSAFVPDA